MDISEETQYASNPTPLVWLITLLGFCTGVILMAIVWWTLIDIQTARENLETAKSRQNAAWALLERRLIQEKWELYKLLDSEEFGEKPSENVVSTNPVILVKEYRSAVHDSNLSEQFNSLEASTAHLMEMRKACMSWAEQKSANNSSLPEVKQKIESILHKMGEEVDRAYSRKALGEMAESSAELQDSANSRQPSQGVTPAAPAAENLSALRRDIIDLALYCERLRAGDTVEYIGYLKDNNILPLLINVRHDASLLFRAAGRTEYFNNTLLDDFESALFGKGYRMNINGHTVTPGVGGYYPLNVSRVLLDQKRQELRLEVLSRVDQIDNILKEISTEITASTEFETARAEVALKKAWQTMVSIWIVAAAIFLFISHRIIMAIEKQVRAIEETNKQLDARTQELFKSREALQDSEERLRHLSSNLLTAQESERRRISLELHDELGQSLAALKLQVRSVEKSMGKDPPPVLKEECGGLRNSINQIIENVRRLSRDLSPVVLDDLGFEAAVNYLVNNFSQLGNVKAVVELDDVNHFFGQEAQRNIYRILQELFTNISKHAKATEVRVLVKKKGRKVEFTVKDNGCGFDMQNVLNRNGVEKGLGLTAIAERVRILGGTLDIQTEAGKGTTVFFTVPI